MAKRIVSTTLGVVLALGSIAFSTLSCASDQEQRRPEEQSTELVSPDLRALTFRITFPGLEGKVIRTRGAEQIQRENEYKIKTLWLLEFDATGDKKLKKTPVDVTKKSDGYVNNGTDAHFSYTTKDYDDSETRVFFFIANVPQLPAEKFKVNETKLDDVLSLRLDEISESFLYKSDDDQRSGYDILYEDAGTHYFPMTGFATVGSDHKEEVCPAAELEAEVTLVRTMARIDVVNYIPGFQITDMKIANVFDKCYLHNDMERKGVTSKRSYKPLGEAKRVMNSAGTAPALLRDMASSYAGSYPSKRDEPMWITQAFYLLEGNNEGETYTDEMTYILLKASDQYGDKKEHLYRIPFRKTGETKGLNIRRNHRYILRIGDKKDPAKGMVKFSIEDEPWTLHEMSEQMDLIDVKGEGYVRYSGSRGLISCDAQGKLVSLSLSLKANSISHVGELLEKAELSTDKDKVEIKVKENTTTTPRRGRITLTFTVGSSQVELVILVRQEAKAQAPSPSAGSSI